MPPSGNQARSLSKGGWGLHRFPTPHCRHATMRRTLSRAWGTNIKATTGTPENMLNFLVFAALAAGVILAVCWPVLKGANAGPGRADYDRAVFRDQLAELGRDRARGLIGEAEAEAARNEIARRLISVGHDETSAVSPVTGRWIALLAAGFIPAASLALYLAIGAPGRLDTPLKQRLDNAVANSDIPALMAKAEAHLAEKPDDLQGWEVLAPLYRGSERYADAATAYFNIL